MNNLIEELKKFSINNNKTDNKEIYILEEFSFEGYDTGAIINEFDDGLYETYLYIESDGKVASKLLLKESKDLETAKKYYSELLDLAKDGNISKIKEKLND